MNGAHPFIIINGCPRSGTSLLGILLAKKFNAAVQPETHFLPLFATYLFLWGNLGKLSARRALIQAIYDFTEIRTNGTGLNVDQMRPYCLLATQPEMDRIARSTGSYPEIVSALFQEYRKIHNGTAVVEKTAYYEPSPWNLLAELLPEAKFIHVVRDGRDVAVSWQNTWFGPKSLALRAWLWSRHIDEGLKWEERNPEKYLRIRYEEFISAPESFLQQIGDFTGLPLNEDEYPQSSLDWYEFINKNIHMARITKPVSSQNKQKWRIAMPPEDLALFEAIAGESLEKAGYQRSVPSSRMPRRSEVYRHLAKAHMARLVSPVEWKRRMLKAMPPALRIAGFFRFSLPQVLRDLRLVAGR
jgi:hypothetical protein